jgi:hypothetical protein
MAKDKEVEHEPLTEEQRITALENRVGTNMIALLVMALILIVVISVSITIITLSAFEEEVEVVHVETVSELQQQVTQLSQQNEVLGQQIKAIKKSLLVAQEQLGSTSNMKLLTLVTEQERANQDFLEALRSGMYDLAHMVPGSRTWLEVYGEKVDLAIARSRDRETDLKGILKKSESQEDDDLW